MGKLGTDNNELKFVAEDLKRAHDIIMGCLAQKKVLRFNEFWKAIWVSEGDVLDAANVLRALISRNEKKRKVPMKEPAIRLRRAV